MILVGIKKIMFFEYVLISFNYQNQVVIWKIFPDYANYVWDVKK